jgi:hypothetical protein
MKTNMMRLPENVHWDWVTSSNVMAIAYNAECRQLYVRFQNGGIYRYDGVKPDEFHAFRGASSIGGFLHARIKSKYVGVKVG